MSTLGNNTTTSKKTNCTFLLVSHREKSNKGTFYITQLKGHWNCNKLKIGKLEISPSNIKIFWNYVEWKTNESIL